MGLLSFFGWAIPLTQIQNSHLFWTRITCSDSKQPTEHTVKRPSDSKWLFWFGSFQSVWVYKITSYQLFLKRSFKLSLANFEILHALPKCVHICVYNGYLESVVWLFTIRRCDSDSKESFVPKSHVLILNSQERIMQIHLYCGTSDVAFHPAMFFLTIY